MAAEQLWKTRGEKEAQGRSWTPARPSSREGRRQHGACGHGARQLGLDSEGKRRGSSLGLQGSRGRTASRAEAPSHPGRPEPVGTTRTHAASRPCPSRKPWRACPPRAPGAFTPVPSASSRPGTGQGVAIGPELRTLSADQNPQEHLLGPGPAPRAETGLPAHASTGLDRAPRADTLHDSSPPSRGP